MLCLRCAFLASCSAVEDMKSNIPLFALVVLLSGCATSSVKSDNAGQAKEREAQPVVPKVTADINLNASQQQPAEARK